MLPKNESGDLLFEVLLVNEKGEIMEGSFTTPYFNQGGTWNTPAENSGGNLGVTRRWAISNGRCKESLITSHSVKIGSCSDSIVLSNGVRGFGWGRLEFLVPHD